MEKTFLELKPKIWQHLYKLSSEAYHQGTPSEEVVSAIVKELTTTYKIHKDIAPTVAKQFYEIIFPVFHKKEIETQDYNEIYLSLLDIKELHARLRQESDIRIKKLLVAFVIYARQNPHHSNWIKYDHKVIFYLAGLSKIKTSTQHLLTNKLYTCYNLNMQVVGSAQPIPCFRLDWLAALPPIDEEGGNPAVDIGDYSPTTVMALAESIKGE